MIYPVMDQTLGEGTHQKMSVGVFKERLGVSSVLEGENEQENCLGVDGNNEPMYGALS